MAENTSGEMEMLVPANPGYPAGLDEDNQQVDDGVEALHAEKEIAWSAIHKFVNSLMSEDDIRETRRQFCSCVNSIIEAYKKKVVEIKALNAKIDQLQQTIHDLQTQFASSVCEKCGENRIARQPTSSSMQESKKGDHRADVVKECGEMKIAEQQFSSLSMQEKTTKLAEGQSEVDGGQPVEHMETQTKEISGKRPHENEESDEDETDSLSEDSHHFKCPHAACGLDALLYLFYKIQINFCPSRFIQKVGKVTGYKGISCTQILNNLKDKEGRFLEKIYHKNIEGQHIAVLNEAKSKFNESGHDVGVLSYSTATYKHCVNLYKSEDGKIKTYDANRGKKYIEDWNQAYYVEVCVLEGEIMDGVIIPHISQRWSECHVRHCKREKEKLMKRNRNITMDQDFKSNPGDESSTALQ